MRQSRDLQDPALREWFEKAQKIVSWFVAPDFKDDGAISVVKFNPS
jgi:hypothetical protein